MYYTLIDANGYAQSGSVELPISSPEYTTAETDAPVPQPDLYYLKEGEWTDADEAEYIAEVTRISGEIVANNPYIDETADN